MDSPDKSDNPNNAALEQQQLQQNAELEQKKREIFNTRLEIERSMAGESWTPQPLVAHSSINKLDPNTLLNSE